MEFFKRETNIDFMGQRKITGFLSLTLCIVAMVCLVKFGLNFGLEFTGGSQVELRFKESMEPKQIKKILEADGFSDLRVQHYGSTDEILVRIANADMVDEEKVGEHIKTALKAESIDTQVMRVEFVGSEVGSQLAEQGGMAVLVAIIATMIYIAMRFEYRFAVSAALALCHDSLIVLGVFAFMQTEFDLASLAAVLAVVGYSLNDTIVVFDRVRENFRKIRKGGTSQVMNTSINQTLSRTIMTSWLTLLVVVILLIFGGESLYGFSLALSVGIVVGTYSSIYVAGAFALFMGLSRSDLMPKPRAELDELP